MRIMRLLSKNSWVVFAKFMMILISVQIPQSLWLCCPDFLIFLIYSKSSWFFSSANIPWSSPLFSFLMILCSDRLQVEEVAPRPIFPLHSYHNLQVEINISSIDTCHTTFFIPYTRCKDKHPFFVRKNIQTFFQNISHAMFRNFWI